MKLPQPVLDYWDELVALKSLVFRQINTCLMAQQLAIIVVLAAGLPQLLLKALFYSSAIIKPIALCFSAC